MIARLSGEISRDFTEQNQGFIEIIFFIFITVVNVELSANELFVHLTFFNTVDEKNTNSSEWNIRQPTAIINYLIVYDVKCMNSIKTEQSHIILK